MPVSDEARQRILQKYHDHHERVESPPPADWVKEWNDLAELTLGVSYHDPIYLDMLKYLSDCDRAYHYNDLVTFHCVRDQIRELRQKQWEPEIAQAKAWMHERGI